MRLPSSCTTLVVLLGVGAPLASGMFRFDCWNNLVIDRVDPIVNPGTASKHLHAVSGGNGFSMNADGAAMKASTCTSCPIGADLSAYWVPQLYVKYKNGSGYGLVESHQIVYYEPRGSDNETVIAFPDGLKMLAGDPKLRQGGDSIEQKAITWACINYDNPTPEQQGFPNTKCPQGLRGQVNFPMCWDGVNLDSDDHKSHVAYATGLDGGSCPTNWKKMVKIFYEAFYSVDAYDDEWDGDQHPFVLANGDTTGYSFHGDFLNGWDVDVLQAAIDQCSDENYFDSGKCPPLSETFSSEAPEVRCTTEPEIVEDTVFVKALPGDNPVDGETAASSGDESTADDSNVGDNDGSDDDASVGGEADDEVGGNGSELDGSSGEKGSDDASTSTPATTTAPATTTPPSTKIPAVTTSAPTSTTPSSTASPAATTNAPTATIPPSQGSSCKTKSRM